MPVARLICKEEHPGVTNPGFWTVVVEQMDFTPAPGQIVITPAGDKFRVLNEMPVVNHLPVGAGLPAKWMNVVKVEHAADKPTK